MIKIQNVKLSLDAVSDLISTALEGGSNYWYQIVGHDKPASITFRSSLFKDDEKPHPYYDFPLNEGGAVHFEADGAGEDNQVFTLNLESIHKGLNLLLDKYPSRLAAIVDESYDAEDADVFLQASLFGEVVFG